jgi:hypothetical protein
LVGKPLITPCVAATTLQAQQRLLDLAFTILKRFGEGQAPNSSAAAAADTLAVPGGVPRAGAGAAAGAAAGGGGGRATAAAAGAAASGSTASSTWSESLGFAPLVVATLKVGWQLGGVSASALPLPLPLPLPLQSLQS